ncbi:hypothetical protein BN946_scf184845.g14 [Trametes cinnabarina]|uniref:Uncharacterized protein n=1 Tax=Pycnoporus cinnabarinus TaxID=5643 RepID=A0A060SFW1_PYCCI|nr:hypothetical protein BN946_scf184845.g14 [Trametes cinnabarina]
MPAAPIVNQTVLPPGRGRGRSTHPVVDRRWEPNDAGRRPAYIGPPPSEPFDVPPRRSDAGLGVLRDFPDRSIRGPLSNRRDERVPPTRVSGTNNIPIVSRPSGYASDHSAANDTRSPVDQFRPNTGELPLRPPLTGSESYDRRRQAHLDLLPGPRHGDRGGRRLSVGQDGAVIRPRGSDTMVEPPINPLPPRPRDGGNQRQLPHPFPHEGSVLRGRPAAPPPFDESSPVPGHFPNLRWPADCTRSELVPQAPGHRAGRPHRQGRSPVRMFSDRPRGGDIDRDVPPPRPMEEIHLAPARERTPPAPQNGHRPSNRRHGSLLERLTLDEAPADDGGSSLRDRVDVGPQRDGQDAAAGPAASMDLDGEEGNGGARGFGRKRIGKSRRPRRN